MTTCVAYCRISRDRTGAELGVDRQAEDCRKVAKELGFDTVEVIADNDMGAWSGKRRPGYEQLLAGLRERRWQTLITWHIDRLTRSPKDLETLVDVLNGAGVALRTVKGGEVDLTSAEGRMTARILGTMARYESDHRSDRTRRKLLQNAEAGKAHGGPRAYGYDTDGVTVRPDEAAVIVDMADRVRRGETLYSIARDLTAKGVPTAHGARKWHPNTVRGVLLNPRHVAQRIHKGKVIGPAAWPAVVEDPDLWDAVQSILTDPSRKPPVGGQPARLLSGIALCGVPGCGGTVRAGSRGSRGAGKPIYRCAEADHLSRAAGRVDDVVTDVVVAWLARDGATYDGPVGPVVDNRARIDTLQVLVSYAEDALLGNPPDHLKGVSLGAVQRNLAAHRAELEQLRRDEVLSVLPSPLAGVTAENFPDLSLERRRAVVDYLVEVVILPARTGRRGGDEAIRVTPKS